MNRKWKKFQTLTGKCYEDMIHRQTDGRCWQEAFELLTEIVREERKINPRFAPELEQLDDVTDWQFDIEGWLEDCLDEIDMREEYEVLLNMCEELLKLFGWPEYTGSDLKFRKASALMSLGKAREAAVFCDKWIAKEPENIIAATAGVYTYLKTGEVEKAEKLIEAFIPDGVPCGEENDVMFTAASRFYQQTGNRKKYKKMEKALEEYDQYLEDYFLNCEDMDGDDLWDDSDLPFN